MIQYDFHIIYEDGSTSTIHAFDLTEGDVSYYKELLCQPKDVAFVYCILVGGGKVHELARQTSKQAV